MLYPTLRKDPIISTDSFVLFASKRSLAGMKAGTKSSFVLSRFFSYTKNSYRTYLKQYYITISANNLSHPDLTYVDQFSYPGHIKHFHQQAIQVWLYHLTSNNFTTIIPMKGWWRHQVSWFHFHETLPSKRIAWNFHVAKQNLSTHWWHDSLQLFSHPYFTSAHPLAFSLTNPFLSAF